MPISTLNMRKCKECGELFCNITGDCISASDLIIKDRFVCDKCLNKRRSEDSKSGVKKNPLLFFNDSCFNK